ncbi:hypothetical protein T552_01733 [Pneumocystis carinii B80]|uniref:Mitochondrial aspartate-glutamate transporter AGC1 n=1 Tax=Pneumocystis carinii (strain B80) TaxID=1408658 RepID=A0A0W4ZJC5_PNEC8|nr:hypothetical protein T552_01733 [Pneumocystis carinii B80]KTW28473.1 hypothetical protein T552_01733 [Pneumocystis carinii B80]
MFLEFKSMIEQVVSIFGDKMSEVEGYYKNTFERYATVEKEDEIYMNNEDFVNAITSEGVCEKVKREEYDILFKVADVKKRGLLSEEDWICFGKLLGKYDAEYQIVFKFFDVEGTGKILYEDFKKMIFANESMDSIPFNWNSSWLKKYMNNMGKYGMTYPEFIEMIKDLEEERIKQAFVYYDKENLGYIGKEEFSKIINKVLSHKLSDYLLKHLDTLCEDRINGEKISYANIRAFQNVIRKAKMIEGIVRAAILKSSDSRITRIDFMREAEKMGYCLFTPMEMDILFHFVGLDNDTGRLSYQDFIKVLDATWKNPIEQKNSLSCDELKVMDKYGKIKKLISKLLDSIYHFSLGAVAGASGAILVYPIDLVKTRMQNARTKMGEQILYKNSFDCAKKVLKKEGILGLYSGMGPQLIGVIPEKATKLTVNNLVRNILKDDNGKIKLYWEILAGASAGASQVIFTNPLEIVKIRLQTQGEHIVSSRNAFRKNALFIIKDLGLSGLYKGTSACLLRDIPFSAIYFPVYSHLKNDYFKEDSGKKLKIVDHFISGAIAGIPAAYFTTPADVIKTRLQVEARRGETTYKSIRHAFFTIIKEEGVSALFKGGPARVFRSSPQFACTLAVYETLHSLFLKSTHSSQLLFDSKEKNVSFPYLRSCNALQAILDMDINYGNYFKP